MRLIDYDFVFVGWDRTQGALDFGWAPVFHECLPYVQFWIVTPDNAITVRCDPCSLDQDRTAYAAMVRTDLEQATAKQKRSQPPEFDIPARLARHLRETNPGMAQDGGDLTLYFHDDAKALRAFWLVHEVMGGGSFEQASNEVPNPAADVADSFARPRHSETSSADQCMQAK